MVSSKNLKVKPGVHLIVTIFTIAEKAVSDDSDQMDTSLLMMPTIVTIIAIAIAIAIAGIGSGSISAIVTIVNDRNDHMGTVQRS